MINQSPPPVRELYQVKVDKDGTGSAEIPAIWQKWFNDLYSRLSPVYTLPSYTLATLPDATKLAGGIIYVSDGTSGSNFKGSNGTAWVNLG